MRKDNKKSITKRAIVGVSVPVFIMGLVSLFTDISSETIQSILPLFIFEVGGTGIILGLISGVSDAIANVLKGITGWLSDRINRRKPFVVFGYSLSNISKPFIGFSPSWQFILGLKITDRVGKGLRTSSRDTLISYYAIKKGKAFGIHRAMDTLGAVIGSFTAVILLLFNWSFSNIIFFTIFPGIIAIILILFIKDISPQEVVDQPKAKKQEYNFSGVDKNFIKLIILLGVIEFASLDISFLIIRAADFIPINLIFIIPLLYSILNIVYAIFSPITGSLSDKIGRKPVILFGLALLLFSCIILIFPITTSLFSLILITIIYILYGFYMASVDPISRAYIADLVGKDKRGKAYGYYYFSVGFISMIESIIFGLIYDMFSASWAFLYISILLILSMIIFAYTDFSKIVKTA
ncbi:MAG: MFS transporter [Promethearchaeota archaeon]|nr:MAG: MFS transporter [Candidatus Lokiarchaeota archaeon]